MQPLKEVSWAEVDREPPFVLDGGILRPADQLMRIDYRMGMGKMMGGAWDLSIIIFLYYKDVNVKKKQVSFLANIGLPKNQQGTGGLVHFRSRSPLEKLAF